MEDAGYYLEHGDRLGFGPGRTVDAERLAYLRRWVQGRVLDVGCATGLYVDALARSGLDAHGLDFATPFIEHARAHRKGTFHVGDAHALPFADETFDTVLALDLLEHVDDAAVLAELVRVARRRILLVVPATTPPALRDAGLLYRHHEDASHQRTYTPDDLRGLLAGQGIEPHHLEGVGAVDLAGLLKATVRGRTRWGTTWLHRALFKVLRHATVRPWHSAWLAVADR